MRAAIIEDEKPAARLLENMIRKLRPEWEITTIPGNIESAVSWFDSHPHPDVLFLDIHLSDGNSFIFVEQAHPESIIIFTTAYDEYAIRAFTVNSIDYLLKPIRIERLSDAIEKFEKLALRSHTSQQALLLEALQSLAQPEKRYRTRFLINGNEKLITINSEDIAYFYSMNKITFAITREGKEHIINLSLDKLGEQLNPDKFFRANRQTIVNIDAITKIEPFFHGKVVAHTTPKSKERILVSKEKLALFKLWLNY